MRIKFTKMHGAGNDFIVLDGIHQDLSKITTDQWRFLAHRQFGIGADQIVIVEKAQALTNDFRYRIINNDGSEVEQCGNGSRCFVRFVREHHLTEKQTVRVEVAHTVLTLSEDNDGQVTVNMGAPVFEPNQVPFNPNQLSSKTQGNETLFALNILNQERWISAISMGNPHAVQVVNDVENYPVHIEGPIIESHPSFPRKVNAGFMEILNRHSIRLRVFERGAGETLACGTGACAAVVAGIHRGLLDSPVKVHTHGGLLQITWDFAIQGGNAPVLMTGPAQTVFEGEIELPISPSDLS